MRRTTPIFLAICLLSVVSACKLGKLGSQVQGSGVRKSEKRDLPPFKAIDMEGAVEIQAVCQKTQSVEIEGDDNILPLIGLEVRDGVLRIRQEQSYNSREGIIVRLGVPDLDDLQTTGAAKVRIRDVKNDNFRVHSTGASQITVSGETKTIEIRNTGAGSIDAHNLHAQRVDVSATGAAKVEVYASEQLEVTVSGVASVSYGGDPKVVKKTVNGAGVIEKREPSSF